MFIKRRLEFLKEVAASGTVNDPDLVNRRTGRTTAIALSLLSEAMLNPNTEVKMRDHYMTTHKSLRVVQLNNCKNLIKTLQLEGFVFNETKLTIKYSLDGDENVCI